ncbi:DUF4148 domain-containing protein [Variovorax ginsengisoli]|uniref:DUF4148 domain-containing protein n=1 Tax=Variovorax ginsengisoli TaxID=363844 RepID=A0ABT8SED5_9BURK|nr:DUF4148 domain-containing protein [Variovorax ginsengisoli]MDN8618113.1 DUF4148 domain-containing protein [Variovorax ginsengisoli]MDO1537283.1 DUF4148 domain-containing protein [Variovorax ginsengisoli]
MKTMNILSYAALTLLVATGAQAEPYDGVHPAVSSKSRQDVNAEAVRTASAPNQNVARGSRGPETVAASKDRAIVEAEAIRTASAPDQNVASGSRVNSKVVSTMPHPAEARAQAK